MFFDKILYEQNSSSLTIVIFMYVTILGGMAVILNGSPISQFLINYWYVPIIAIIVIAELLFFFMDDQEPTGNESKLLFTAGRKIVALLESGVITATLIGFTACIVAIGQTFISNGIPILETIGGIILVILIIVGYIWLNSLKFREKKTTKKRG